MSERAEIKKQEQFFTAKFHRNLDHPRSEVWNMLTDNKKLVRWFRELTFEDDGQNRSFLFDMGNGKEERLSITDYEKECLLAFDWWKDHVRFELYEENGATELILIEKISAITGQTAKDLAGWHVCLDNIERLLNGEEADQLELWESWHPEYKRLLDSMTVELE